MDAARGLLPRVGGSLSRPYGLSARAAWMRQRTPSFLSPAYVHLCIRRFPHSTYQCPHLGKRDRFDTQPVNNWRTCGHDG